MVADLDGDDRLDLYLTSATGQQALMLGDGEGGFADYTAWRGLGGTLPPPVNGATAMDIDDDGDLDLLVHTEAGVRVQRQDGGVFVEGGGDSGLEDSGQVMGGTLGDFDGDARLDLFLNHSWLPPDDRGKGRLFLGRGDGRFERVETWSEQSGTGGLAFASVAVDLDGDQRSDLLVLRDKMELAPNSAFVQGGTSDLPLAWHTELSDGLVGNSGTMGVGVFDANADGLDDLFLADSHRNLLYLADGTPGGWYDAAAVHGVDLAADEERRDAWGVVPQDFDGDGFTDVFLTFSDKEQPDEQPDELLRNVDGVRFEAVGDAWGLDSDARARGAVAGDLDRDGVPDVTMCPTDGPAKVLLMPCNGASRLTVQLRGHAGDTYGVGARVRIEAGGLVLEQELRVGFETFAGGPAELYFGLADADRVDRLEVRWTDGTRNVFEDLPVDALLRVTRE